LSYKDYVGKRVGILTGSSFEQPTFEFLPDSEHGPAGDADVQNDRPR